MKHAIPVKRSFVIAAMAFTLLVSGCSWGQMGHDASRTAWSPAENVITPANAGALAPLWQTPPLTAYGAQIANGTVYSIDLVSTPNRLLAFSADGSKGCSGTPKVCTPQWTAPLSVKLGIEALGGAYAVEGDRVYVVGYVPVFAGPWRLLVFDAHGQQGCSGTPKICTPLWSANWGTSDANGRESLAIAGGHVYVSTPRFPEAVTVFDAAGIDGCTTSAPITCSPQFATADFTAGTIAVGAGHLVVNHPGFIRVFDAAGVDGCTNHVCTQQRGVENMSLPAISGHTVYSIGAAFDLDSTVPCPAPSGCEPTWRMTFQPFPAITAPAVAAGKVFVASNDVEVFDAAGVDGCSGAPPVCTPIARLVTGDAAQRVSATASLVFATKANGSAVPGAKLLVFDLAGVAGCSGTPTVCQPLKSFSLPDDFGIPYNISIANGIVTVTGDGGAIRAFAVPQ